MDERSHQLLILPTRLPGDPRLERLPVLALIRRLDLRESGPVPVRADDSTRVAPSVSARHGK